MVSGKSLLKEETQEHWGEGVIIAKYMYWRKNNKFYFLVYLIT